MLNFFIGLIFLFFDFYLKFGISESTVVVIQLLPQFAGCIFLIKGIDEMKNESEQFERIRPIALVVAVVTGVLWLMDLFGISALLGYMVSFINIACSIAIIAITYLLILGIKDIESQRNAYLASDKLKTTWAVYACGSGIAIITTFIPVLSIIGVLVSAVASIIYLVMFHKTRKLYDALPPKPLDEFNMQPYTEYVPNTQAENSADPEDNSQNMN